MHPAGVVGACVLAVFVVVGVDGNEYRRHECDRACRESDSPRDCYYHFTVSVSLRQCVDDGHESCLRRLAITVNGDTPGPLIAVCRNDTVTVDVRNSLPSGMEMSIHWHGLRQRDTPHMDGVSMLTQCPIHSGTTFRYRMLADEPGTFYYRSHSVFQQLDGLYGPFIVRDADRPDGRVIVIAPLLDGLVSTDPDPMSEGTIADLRSTIYDDDTRLTRLVNAAATDCPVRVEGASMTVVAADGRGVVPVVTDNVVLYPGERVDLKTEDGRIGLIGLNRCEGYAIHESESEGSRRVRLQDLHTENGRLEPSPHRVYLPFDLSTYSYEDNPVDFRYKLSETTQHIPSYINGVLERASVYEFNNVSFLYPSSPVLSQPCDSDTTSICRTGRVGFRCGGKTSSQYCECLQVLDLPYNANVDLIVVDEGRTGRREQVLHLHGYTFRVLRTERLPAPLHASDLPDMMDSSEWNLVNPAEKDTVIVPNPGYVVLRLRTDNPGDWLLESVPSKARSGMGLEVVLRVPGLSGIAPTGFPQCRTLKPPDLVIFEE